MTNEHPKRETMSIEEPSISNMCMWEIALIEGCWNR